jgi:hypothetical protein
MKKTFTKKERLAIYKRLLNEVDEPVEASWGKEKYLCWKLLIEMIGLEKFQQLESFGDDNCLLVKNSFPEFKLGLSGRYKLNTVQRIELLNECIKKCQNKIKLTQLEAWLGSDQDNTDNLKQMLLEIVNGEYVVEVLRNDILLYN